MRNKANNALKHSNLLGFTHYIYELLDSCRYLCHLSLIDAEIDRDGNHVRIEQIICEA